MCFLQQPPNTDMCPLLALGNWLTISLRFMLILKFVNSECVATEKGAHDATRENSNNCKGPDISHCSRQRKPYPSLRNWRKKRR